MQFPKSENLSHQVKNNKGMIILVFNTGRKHPRQVYMEKSCWLSKGRIKARVNEITAKLKVLVSTGSTKEQAWNTMFPS